MLVPLARANAAEADTLLGALRQEPLSARELATWYRHYATAKSTARTRMAAHPRLFIQALQAPADASAAAAPEARWLEELMRVRRQLQHLARRLGGLSLHQISRTLGHSRRTVRRVLKEGPQPPPRRRTPAEPTPALTSRLAALNCESRGNVVRMQELLRERHGLEVPYSTLTYWVRLRQLRDPPRGWGATTSPRVRRCSTTPRRIACRWALPRSRPSAPG